MAVIRHYRTALLQAAPTRFNLPPRDVIVNASAYLFKLDTAGNPAPASIAFAVVLIGMEGDVEFVTSAGLTLTDVTGSAAALTHANMTVATGTVKARITVDGQLYESLPVTINKVSDGAAGTSVHTATIYQQSASAPTAPTGGTFNFGTSTLTPPAGWSATQPAASSTPTYAARFTFSTGTPGATVTAGTWAAPVVTAQNGTNGTPGAAGNSARRAYSKSTLASLASTPATITSTGSASFPPNDSWGAGTVWGGSALTLAAGEKLFVTDGVYDPVAGNTVWGVPYEAALKVGDLEAISTKTGSLEVTKDVRCGQTAYDTGTGFWWGLIGGTPKFSIGTAGGASLKWDGTALTLTNATITNPNLNTPVVNAGADVLSTGSTGTRTVVTRTATFSGGNGASAIEWTLAITDLGAGSGNIWIDGAVNTSSVTVKARSSVSGDTMIAIVTCKATDSKGLTGIDSFTAQCNF